MASYGSSLASWVYLADWILVLILGLAFVFWFPRLVGFVVTQILRLVVWRRYKVRISLDAFRISPLGGRITAKNIVVTNKDYTVSILRLNFTWRYWLFKPTRILEFFLPDKTDLGEEYEGISHEQNKKLATSLQLLVEGLEVFMYNRTFAYDMILDKISNEVPGAKEANISSHFGSTSSSATEASPPKASLNGTSDDASVENNAQKSNSVGFLIHILPISLRIKKGAFVLGNPTTPTILVASFKSAVGLVDFHKAPSAFDRYRSIYDLNMEKMQVSMKPNLSHDPLRYSSEAFADKGGIKTRRSLSIKKFKSFFRKALFRKLREKRVDLDEEWRGLRRYIDDFQDERLMNLATIEGYAKYSVILDSVSTQMLYYYDVPGPTIPESLAGPAPKFGVDLTLSMATFHYGPWADRQRGPLQTLLFPVLSRDGTPSPSREPWGSPRTYNGFDLNIIVKDELIIRTPTRELTKDREELAHYVANKNNPKITRPFGWFELKLASNSRITSFNAYKATKDGWGNKVSCFFDHPEMRSSVNHDVVFTADQHTIECDIGFPLKWNGEAVWTFNNESKNGQLFFLRDHAFLFSDLLSDFASGTPAPYEQFRAFMYKMNWNIQDYKLHFNVNDHNIINNALDFNNNKYICFHGKELRITSSIPLLGNFAKSSTIDYNIFTDRLNLSLEVPPWHTASSFLKGDKKMGQADNFEISGSYTLYRNIEINFSNFATINAIGENITLLFFGFFIRYLFTFRENYMGDYKHFKTFEEYTHGANLGFSDDSRASLRSMASNESSVREKIEDGEPDYWDELKTQNELNVLFTFKARNGLILLPCNIYDHTSNIGLNFDYLDIDIHLTQFYMDLQADFSPITGYHFTKDTPGNYHNIIYDIDEYREVGKQAGHDIIIDNFQVHTHRMLGLAPSLLTYHCKWDFSCASLLFDTEPACLAAFKSIGANFATGFKDLENTFIYEIPLVFDMANFTFRCDMIGIKLDTGIDDVYFQLKIHDTLIAFCDRANDRYSSKICVSMPKITAEVIDALFEKKYHFHFNTSLMFTDICRKAWPNDFKRSQQAWARRNDAPSHRIPHLIDETTKDSVYDDAYGCLPPSVSLPNASVPLTDEYYLLRENKGYDDDLPSIDSLEDSTFNCDASERFDPTTHYHEPDFQPESKHEPGHKTDSLILEFDAINGFLCPEALAAFLGLAQGFGELDIEVLLDSLQAKTVKDIKMLITPLSSCTNLRFVTPEINFRITQEPLLTPDDVLCSSPRVPIVTINIQEPSVAFTQLATRTKDNLRVYTEGPLALAVHTKAINCFVHDPQFFSPSATLVLEELEAWLSKDKTGELVSSAEFQDVRMSIFQGDLHWISHFILTLKSGFANASKKVPKKPPSNGMERLIYLIAMSTGDSGFDHDPSVITKPSSILRSVDDHVRFHEGWKLVAKFRSIVNRLSSDDYAVLEQSLIDSNWDLPSTAKDDVSRTFGAWRSWEQFEEGRDVFYSSIFDKEIKQKLACKMHLDILKFNFELIDPEGLRDNLLIQNSSVTVHQFPTSSGAMNTAILLDFSTIEGNLSLTIFKALKCFETLSKEATNGCGSQSIVATSSDSEQASEKSLYQTPNGQKGQLVFLFLSIKLANFKFSLPYTFFELSIFESFNCYQRAATGLCVASSAKNYSLCFGRDEMNHFDSSIDDVNLLVAEAVSNEKVYQVDFKLGSCEVKILDFNGELLKTLRLLLKEDLAALKAHTKSKKKAEANTDRGSFDVGSLPAFETNFTVGHASFDIQLLSPLVLQISFLKTITTVRHQNASLSYASGYQKFIIDTKLNDFPLLRAEDTHTKIQTEVSRFGNLWAVKGDLSLGYLKVTNLSIINSLHAVMKNLTVLKDRILDLKQLSPPKDHQVSSNGGQTTNPMQSVVLLVNIKQENMSIATHKDQCRFTLDFDGIALNASNIHDSPEGLITPTLLYGGFSIPVMRVSVFDPSIPVGLSTIVDFNITAKISNDAPEVSRSAISRSLQIESEHLRVCLSPLVLFRIVDFLDLTTRAVASFDFSKADTTETGESSAPQEATSKAPSGNFEGFKFSSVHVLSYNFCFGWLFGSKHKDYPGIILGAERIFAATKKEMGKLSLMEGYLSSANGSTSTSFYSLLSELNSLNRAFMPKMQFNYCIMNDKDLWVDLKGDELDVRFMSNSLVIVERAVKSGSEVQEFFKQRSRVLQRRKSYREQMALTVKKKPRTPFKPPFSSVLINVALAGSKVLFYRLQEEDLLANPPSLALQSPSVNLTVYYKHHKLGPKKHTIIFEVLMKLSDNTVYSSCVPIIMDFVETSKLMLRTSKRDEPDTAGISDPLLDLKSESNFGNILKDIEFHVGIVIEKQRLSLSCEPTAKVAAVVEFDGASILSANNLENPIAIDVLARINSIGASLQHIYSDERSGFVGIKDIVISNSITFDKTVSIVSSGSISDVSANVKMKQYQDVDLFKDIWIPKKYHNTRRKLEAKLTTRRLHLTMKEMASTYAIPLSITFILCNLALEVDFGVALGVVMLEVNKGWMVSRKTADWFFDMNFGIHEMLVRSCGRLGGYVQLKRANVHSSVEWKLKEHPLLDVPLVKFYGGFESIAFKLAFDQHNFAVGNLERWQIEVYNRKNGINILKDHIYVMIQYKTSEIFLTSLAASDFHDIFSTISRMIDEKRTSYREILNDSKQRESDKNDEVPMKKLLEVVKKLETNIEVRTGNTAIQVYPQAFDDSRVLYIQLDKSEASFFQNEYTLGVSNEIELKFNNLKASLSSTNGASNETINAFSVPEFAAYARKARGGLIFLSPKFMISMRTFQRYNCNIIEYLFQSSFGGTVDVRWNLGSVNCVREMYAAHKRAFASRTEYSKNKAGALKDTKDIEETVLGINKPPGEEETFSGALSSSAKMDIDRDINQTIEKVVRETDFTYVPLAPPIIEAPRLKELGNATPPLEWFGLHRDKFPDATHQLAIVTLQKLIKQIDDQYFKALGERE